MFTLPDELECTTGTLDDLIAETVEEWGELLEIGMVEVDGGVDVV